MKEKDKNKLCRQEKIELDEINELKRTIAPSWVIEVDCLKCEFNFDEYKELLSFVNQIGIHADEEKHYPIMHLMGNRAVIEVSTPAVAGHSKKDFDLASKIDAIYATF